MCGTRIRGMIQHRDISRRYLMSVYGLVGWRDTNRALTVRCCRNVQIMKLDVIMVFQIHKDNPITCHKGHRGEIRVYLHSS